TLIALPILLGLIVGCAGKRGAPEWFVGGSPNDPNYLFSRTTATSKDLQLALNKAKEEARLDIARQIQVKIEGMTKRFFEETGLGEDSEVLSFFQDVSKSVVSEVLRGCSVWRQSYTKEGMLYRGYVMMAMPVGAMYESYYNKLKANERMYTRFRATQAFKELEEEVRKYEQFKKEQGLMP
ncbi:TPA: hypothetical protein EYP37_04620, partial [Candidatus Poribacteria bacterium]|nr:hypothetical protein [Candidatus Poribacteria bacterium]